MKEDIGRRLEAAQLYCNVLNLLQQLRTLSSGLEDVQSACQSNNYGKHLAEVHELIENHKGVNTDLKSIGLVLGEIGRNLRRLREQQTPAEVAPTLQSALQELQSVEKSYELCKGLVDSRHEGLLQSERYHRLVEDCREELAWLPEKQMQFESMEVGRDLTQAQAQMRKFDVLQGELSARWHRTNKLLEEGKRMANVSSTSSAPQPHATADIQLLCEGLVDKWERVRRIAAEKQKLLETSVKLHKVCDFLLTI